jgi:hypothetical protein
LRFLHFKVLATLASGRDWQRLTPKILGWGLTLLIPPWRSTGSYSGFCHLTLEAMSPPRHIYALFFPDRKTMQ